MRKSQHQGKKYNGLNSWALGWALTMGQSPVGGEERWLSPDARGGEATGASPSVRQKTEEQRRWSSRRWLARDSGEAERQWTDTGKRGRPGSSRFGGTWLVEAGGELQGHGSCCCLKKRQRNSEGKQGKKRDRREMAGARRPEENLRFGSEEARKRAGPAASDQGGDEVGRPRGRTAVEAGAPWAAALGCCGGRRLLAADLEQGRRGGRRGWPSATNPKGGGVAFSPWPQHGSL